jgi:DNA-binding beta-propeller fold protein YncE
VNRRQFVVAAATAPFALGRVPEALARSLAGTPMALVTADTESHIAAVDLSSGRIVHRLPTLAGPRSIETVGGSTAVVAHTTGGAVSIVEAAPLRVRDVIRGFKEPRYTAAAADPRHAYVSDSGLGEVVVIDVLRGRVVYRTRVGGPARHLSADPHAGRLWVALGPKAAEVAVLDISEPIRPKLVDKLRPPFLAHDVGFTPDRGHVWVTSGDRGELAVYDAATGKVGSRLAADAPPQHVTFAGGVAYVTSGDDGLLRVHRLRDGRRLRTTKIPVGSYNVQAGWLRILTPSLDRGTLCVVRQDGTLEEQVQVARSSHDACVVVS